MAKPRKLWSQLAQSTRDRYTKAGITARQYNSGNIPADAKSKATGKKVERKAPKPRGHVFTSKARGKTKRFDELSETRQRRDINRVINATGATEKEARRLLRTAAKRGEILQLGPVVGPATREQEAAGYYGNTVYQNISAAKGKAFARMSIEDRSRLAQNFADIRRGHTPRYAEGDLPDWPYPDELDAEGWKAYQEAVS